MRIAYLILGESSSAEDVAQETFLRAYRSLDRFDTTRPLRPWLVQISANQARNHRRSLGRYWHAIQRVFQEANTHGTSFQNPGMEKYGEYQELWMAIQKLSPPDQQVIYCRYFLELSVTETAIALDVAEGTVKSRLSRAVNRLREVIGRDFPSFEEYSPG